MPSEQKRLETAYDRAIHHNECLTFRAGYLAGLRRALEIATDLADHAPTAPACLALDALIDELEQPRP